MTDDAIPPYYRQNPRPTGQEIAYRLDGHRLTVDSGRKVSEVQLGAVEEVRLSFEPRSLAHNVLRTRLRLTDGRSITLTSITWRSMIQAERQDQDYGAFVRRLVGAIAAANPGARFVAGKNPLLWAASAIVAGILLVAMAVFAWRAFQMGAQGTALMTLAVMGLGVWQLEPIVRLNKPRSFDPKDPPRDLVP